MSWKRKSLGALVFTAKYNAQYHYPVWEPDEWLWWSWELYLTWENVLETERRKVSYYSVSNNHHALSVCIHMCSAWNVTPYFYIFWSQIFYYYFYYFLLSFFLSLYVCLSLLLSHYKEGTDRASWTLFIKLWLFIVLTWRLACRQTSQLGLTFMYLHDRQPLAQKLLLIRKPSSSTRHLHKTIYMHVQRKNLLMTVLPVTSHHL